MDSVGIGAMPDAAAFGDEGSDTLGNIAKRCKIELPNLCRLGLGNIKPLPGLPPSDHPAGAYGKCRLASPGKDTTTGHWEMAGIVLEKAFPVYPHGFPPEVIECFEQRTGRKTLGNKAASGTEIIAELGEQHMRTGSLIVYTSADSVFQVAAHQRVVPLDELYRICEIARGILCGPTKSGASSHVLLKVSPATLCALRTGKISPFRHRPACFSIGCRIGALLSIALAKSPMSSSIAVSIAT